MSDAHPNGPDSPPSLAWLALLLAGVGLGALLTLGLLDAAALIERRYPPGGAAGDLPQADPNVAVRLSFVETATASAPAWRLVQGLGLRMLPVTFRAAVIEHPEGVVVFSTGAESAPGLGVSNPFGALTARDDLAEALSGLEVEHVIFPTLRWMHVGSWNAFPDATRWVSGSEQWNVTGGSMPARYGYDSAGSVDAAAATRSIGYSRTQFLGRDKLWDVYGDGTVVVGTLRGSSFDEAALLVTLGSGRRVLLVGDLVWHRSQVTELRPRGPWAVWFFDRNRLRLPSGQRRLHALDALDGVEVYALLDGEADLPRFPASWE